MHIFLGSHASNLLVISFGEKCLLKSLHSCGSFVFSSSRVIVEIAQKQHSGLLNKGRVRLLELLAENAWSNSMLHNTEQIFESCITALLILFRIVSTGPCGELWCHLCETWELWEGRVYSTVNHHVWCGLSGRVRGGNVGSMQSPRSNEAV